MAVFPARDVPAYAEPVEPASLVVGAVYFAVTYVDADLLFPIVEPRVFVGRNLAPGDSENHYFQDLESYQRGVRYPTGDGDDAAIHHGDAVKHMFTFEK